MCATKLGSISLIDILDTVAPLSTHILSLTPSAPWLNSPLAHEQRQDGLSGHLHFFVVLESSPKRVLVGLRRQNIALIHLDSPQRSEVIAEVNPKETGPSFAWWHQAEIENHSACKSDSLNSVSQKKKILLSKTTKKIFLTSFYVSQNTTSQ